MAQSEALSPLAGRRIAVPETRHLDVLEGLLTRRGAEVMRCPLMAIIDAPNPAPVAQWLHNFVARPPDFFIILTGEGLARLRGFAARAHIPAMALKRALAQTTMLSRGPKPARELRRLSLAPQLYASSPTTAGVIESLQPLDLAGKAVAVQLYGDDPNAKLCDYLLARGATVAAVAPYRYAPQLSRDGIANLITQLSDQRIDAVVFTSQLQVHRLFEVATDLERVSELASGLEQTCVSAVGPLVSSALRTRGCAVDVEPHTRYFMKPLVHALSTAFASHRPAPG